VQKPTSIFVSGTAKQILPTGLKPGVALNLFRALTSFGFLMSGDPNSEFFISINHNRKAYSKFIRSGGIPKNAILVRREPQAVHPIQYQMAMENRYGLILSPGAVAEIQHREVLLNTPYVISANPNSLSFSDQSIRSVLSSPGFAEIFTLEHWYKRKYFLTLFASNKVSPSKRQNYSIRRKIVKVHGDEIEVFGQLWSASALSQISHRTRVLIFSLRSGYLPSLKSIYGSMFHKYPNCHGIFEDKFAITRNTKFSLVIENDSTCITEKLFDAFFSGNIPIYLGPDLAQYGIPDDLYVRMKEDFTSSLTEIRGFQDVEIQKRLSAIFSFISAPDFYEKWSDEKVFASIAQEIHQYIRESS